MTEQQRNQQRILGQLQHAKEMIELGKMILQDAMSLIETDFDEKVLETIEDTNEIIERIDWLKTQEKDF